LWTYIQKTGELYNGRGHCTGVGYAGNGDGKNNPAMQSIVGVGPLPCGWYTIDPELFDHPHCGKDCLRLYPHKGNTMYGRDGFLIHGDSIHKPGTASDGCIIQCHNVRVFVAVSGDTLLQVIDDHPPVCDPEISI
jgi:hypothetical protein